MKTEPKKRSPNPFGDWIKTIPVGYYDDIRNRIIAECQITDQIFRHWKAGNSKVPNLAKPIIENIAGKPIFNFSDDEHTQHPTPGET
jgi:hypothetical protein